MHFLAPLFWSLERERLHSIFVVHEKRNQTGQQPLTKPVLCLTFAEPLIMVDCGTTLEVSWRPLIQLLSALLQSSAMLLLFVPSMELQVCCCCCCCCSDCRNLLNIRIWADLNSFMRSSVDSVRVYVFMFVCVGGS